METPKGKYIFGAVTVGEKGQIVIPKKAREVFTISPGDRLVVFGDINQGIGIIKESALFGITNKFFNSSDSEDSEE